MGNALICDSEALKANYVAKVQNTCEAFEAAKEQQLESAEAFSAVRKEIEVNDTLLQVARQDRKRLYNIQRQTEKKLKEAQSRLDAFRQGPLSIFAALRDRDQVDATGNDPSGVTNDLVGPEAAMPMEVA